MKKLNLIPLLLIALCCFVTSCTKENNDNSKTTGTITFSYNSILNKSAKTLSQDVKGDSSNVDIPQTIVISITDNSGNLVYNLEEIPLYNMNGNYISKPISLEKGNYKLTDFLVVNKDGKVLYLAPKEESPKAYLVSDPLPIGFNVNKDQVTKVGVEVIKNTGEDPIEFGYTTFSFNVVDVINFHVGVFIYNDSNQNFELTTANIEIQKDGTRIYDNTLYPITASISLRKDVGVYTVIIKKDGYQDYILTLTLSDLQGYTANNPLVAILSKATYNLTKGLVAYYPFNGNANDVYINKFNGIVHGAVLTKGRNNVDNGAYYFNGVDNYIELPTAVASNSDNDFSIEAWVNNNGITNDGKYNDDAIYGQSDGNSGSDFPFIAIEVKSDMTVRGVVRGIGSSLIDIRSQATLQINTWHHVVMVKKTAVVSIYLDGELVCSGNTTLAGNTTSNDFVGIGAYYDDLQGIYHAFHGKIDMVRIWSKALTQVEIRDLIANDITLK